MATARSTRSRSRGRPPHDDVLTPAEWRIAHAVTHGMTNRAIAERRGISIDAVKFHLANIVAKLGVKNRNELRQWFRTPKGSALSRRPLDMTKSSGTILDGECRPEGQGTGTGLRSAPLTLGQIGQISRTVKDIVEAQQWYGKVLGLPHLYTFDRLAFFDCGGTRLMLTQNGEVSTGESVLYWRVENIVNAYETLKARGAEFISAPHMIHRHPDGTEEWMAFFKDPEGRALAIMSQVEP
jgi:DNA-binding CsgD family transcriptional regulator/predicted enzyme related to lactoylglutathione lyase